MLHAYPINKSFYKWIPLVSVIDLSYFLSFLWQAKILFYRFIYQRATTCGFTDSHNGDFDAKTAVLMFFLFKK